MIRCTACERVLNEDHPSCPSCRRLHHSIMQDACMIIWLCGVVTLVVLIVAFGIREIEPKP